MPAFRVGELFAGIGGFGLAAERCGWRVVWASEIEPYARAVYRKNFPHVTLHGDITKLTKDQLEPVDVLTGGFPCQDISNAGKRKGIDGERSGLWREYARLIGELRPRYAIVENVGALAVRGLGRVLGDLATLGYDAEWHCIPASAVGVPQRRERLFIVAHPPRSGSPQVLHQDALDATRHHAGLDATCGNDANPDHQDCRARSLPVLGHANWSTIPDRERSGANDGLPDRLDHKRYKCLGNAIVPQVAEAIFRAINAVEDSGSP